MTGGLGESTSACSQKTDFASTSRLLFALQGLSKRGPQEFEPGPGSIRVDK